MRSNRMSNQSPPRRKRRVLRREKPKRGTLPLLLGLAITVAALARLVNNLFERHYALVSRFILGFVIASSLKIVPTGFESAGTLALSLACFAGGFALARYMDCARGKQKKA